MASAYLLLGSNENNREENLKRAGELIGLNGEKILKHSSVYETEAWGLKEQQHFLNQALLVETNFSPVQLLSHLKTIEKKIGRIETIKWGPRVIDIDILFYGNEVVDEPELKIPHPFLHQRKFTLEPLNEIAPEFIHPVLKKTIAELLKVCADTSEVRPTLNSKL